MKEFKGTKGSWYHNFNGEYWEVRRKEDIEDGKSLCVSVFVFDTKTEQVEMIIKEAEADARLIASAPELAKALQDLVETFDYKNQDIYKFASDKIDNAKMILIKAIGE